MIKQDPFGIIQNLQMSPSPQTSFLVGTFFAAAYSKTALTHLFLYFFHWQILQTPITISHTKHFQCYIGHITECQMEGNYLMIGIIIIKFITQFHEFSVNTNLQVFQETEFLLLYLVHDINSPIYFHQYTNIFSVIIILMML